MVAMAKMGGGKHDNETTEGQPKEQLKERLGQLAQEQRTLEAQLAAEPLEPAPL